jgi:hypothetical protein
MNKERNGAIKFGLVFIGASALIVGSAAWIVKKAKEESQTIAKDKVNVADLEKLGNANMLKGPPAGSSGGISFGDSGRVAVTTFEQPVEDPGVFSKEKGVAAQQIQELVDQIGLVDSREAPILVKTQTQKVIHQTPDGPVESEIYVTEDGKVLHNKQEVLDEFISRSVTPEVVGNLAAGKNKSVLDSLLDGSPINISNFITAKPENFPSDKNSSERIKAVGQTLTVNNPGGSSDAAIPNFSRLRAVGTDLSNVDVLKVQNPDFLREIKSGQGPLTPEQKILVNQQRLKIDPRNQTSSDRTEIARNVAAGVAEKQIVTARAADLNKAGYDEVKAKEFLASKGLKINGQLSAQQFAALERQLTA